MYSSLWDKMVNLCLERYRTPVLVDRKKSCFGYAGAVFYDHRTRYKEIRLYDLSSRPVVLNLTTLAHEIGHVEDFEIRGGMAPGVVAALNSWRDGTLTYTQKQIILQHENRAWQYANELFIYLNAGSYLRTRMALHWVEALNVYEQQLKLHTKQLTYAV